MPWNEMNAAGEGSGRASHLLPVHAEVPLCNFTVAVRVKELFKKKARAQREREGERDRDR